MRNHKQYLVFAGDTYYPLPGWHGLISAHDTPDDATSAIRERFPSGVDKDEWFQIVDLHTGKVIGGEGHGFAGMSGLISCSPVTES